MTVKRAENSNTKQLFKGMLFASFISIITAALIYYLDHAGFVGH